MQYNYEGLWNFFLGNKSMVSQNLEKKSWNLGILCKARFEILLCELFFQKVKQAVLKLS